MIFTKNIFFTVNLFFALAAASANATYCKNIYRFAPHSILCARQEIDSKDIDRKIKLTQDLYNKQLGGVESVDGLTIIVLTKEEMNDKTLFNDETKNVVGRYFWRWKAIYITERALEPHNTDLIHELVHHFNAQNHIINLKIDEDLAYGFEAEYGAMY